MTAYLDRIQDALVGLKMPRALEALDHIVQRLERGEVTAIEAIDALLSEEYATRETRRIDIALRTSKLLPSKRSRASTSASSRLSTVSVLQHWHSSTSSGAPRSFTFSGHRAPGKVIWPPHLALRR